MTTKDRVTEREIKLYNSVMDLLQGHTDEDILTVISLIIAGYMKANGMDSGNKRDQFLLALDDLVITTLQEVDKR